MARLLLRVLVVLPVALALSPNFQVAAQIPQSIIIAEPQTEFERLYERIGSTKDPEELIRLIVRALELETDIKFWRLSDPRDYVKAVLFSRLGYAYENRRNGGRADNLEQAIYAYETARDLHARIPGNTLAWALTQVSLGTVLRRRIRGDRADNQDMAISAYEQAEEVFSTNNSQYNWAKARENLGISYASRIRGDRGANIERAINSYADASTIWTQHAFPEDWARLQIHLCDAYRNRRAGADERSLYLEWAIGACNSALEIFNSKDTFPEEWGDAKTSLGLIYAVRLKDGKAQNLEMAIAAFNDALTAHTLGDFPQEWADIELNLGAAYSERVIGDHRANLELAISAYRASLSTLDALEASPLDHLRASRLLGEAYLEMRDWHAAERAFSAARTAFLLLFREGIDDADAREFLDRAGSLFADSAYVAMQGGDSTTALSLIDQGKAWTISVKLSEELHLPFDKQARYRTLKIQIDEWKRLAEATKGAERAAALARLIALRAELHRLFEGPDARKNPDSLGAARMALADGGALIVPIITKIGSKVLIVTIGENSEVSIQPLELERLTSSRLNALVFGDVPGVLGGWRYQYEKSIRLAELARKIATFEGFHRIGIKYFDEMLREAREEYARLDAEWRKAIEDVADLGHFFVGALQDKLTELGIKQGARLVFIPSGALGHLPLGLAKESADKPSLMETYEITYAPNLLTLSSARARLATTDAPSAAVIANPTSNLPFAELEASVVADRFPEERRKVLKGSAATMEVVLSALPANSYWHFATHGNFSWNDARNSRLELSAGESLTVGQLIDRVISLGTPRLVTLSACETGLYDISTSGDEYTGFPGAFLSQGAAGVLSTIWSVDDRATMLLMAKFYDLHRRGGYTPSAALKQAQLWLRTTSASDLLDYARSRLDAEQFSLLENTFNDENVHVRYGAIITIPPRETAPSEAPARSESVPPTERLFQHPFYWAAFVYNGL